MVRIDSRLPRIETNADLAAYIDQQHSVLRKVADDSPDLFVIVGITFTRPLRDDELERTLPLGENSTLGNIRWQGPGHLSGGGGAQWVLPLSRTESELHARGDLGPGESLDGVTHASVYGPIGEIVPLIDQPDIALVDPGDLVRYAAVRETQPEALIVPGLPQSVYDLLRDFRGAP